MNPAAHVTQEDRENRTKTAKDINDDSWLSMLDTGSPGVEKRSRYLYTSSAQLVNKQISSTGDLAVVVKCNPPFAGVPKNSIDYLGQTKPLATTPTMWGSFLLWR